MEPVQKPKYDDATETRPSFVDPLGVSLESDQNKKPSSNEDFIIIEHGPPCPKFTTDNERDSHEDIPKVVDLIPKLMIYPDHLKKRGVLIKAHQLESTVSKPPLKEFNNDKDTFPKTVQEKKERYLKNANDSCSFVSRSYMKKEFKHQSISELLEDQKKLKTSNYNESNSMTESILALLEQSKEILIQDGSNRTDGDVSSKIKESDESSFRLKASNDPNNIDSMKELLTPYVETHFAPVNSEDQIETKNEQPEDSLKEKESWELLDRDEDTTDSLPPNLYVLEDINDDETASNASSGSKIDTFVELSSSAMPAITVLDVSRKDAHFRENTEVKLIQKASCEDMNKPANEHLQTYSSQNQEKMESYLERKSPDSSSGIDTDSSDREYIMVNDHQQLENKNKMNRDYTDSESKCSADSRVKVSCPSEILRSDEIKTAQDIPKNNESSLTELFSSSLSISDKQTQELVDLVNDVNNYSRAALAVLQAQPLYVIPNIKFSIPTALTVRPELPETLKNKYESLGFSNPTLPSAASSTPSTTIPTAYTPYKVDGEPDVQVQSTSTAVQPSDENASIGSEEMLSHQSESDSTENCKSVLRLMFNENHGYVDSSLKRAVGVWIEGGGDIKIRENYFASPQYNENLPDRPNSDKFPDHDDEPTDLEILKDRRRAGIVYPGIPIPPPQNPTPVPVPEREPSPDQNQEPVPETETSPDAEPTPAPEPTPEPQEDQTTSVQEEPSTSEPTTKLDFCPPNLSEFDDLIVKKVTPIPIQDILEPGDLSKYIRQSQTRDGNLVSPEDVIHSPDVHHDVNSPDLNAIPSKQLINESKPRNAINKIAPVPISPDRKVEPPKPPNPSGDNPNEPMPLDGSQIEMSHQKYIIEPKPRNLQTNEDNGKINLTVHEDGIEVDACPVPDIPDEEPGPINPPEIPHDRQNGPSTIYEYGNVGRVCSGNRRRTRSLNQPTSPKFKPIYHPGTNNEYASILCQEESSIKKPLQDVNKPKESLIEKSRIDSNDHTYIETPFESKSDESSMSTVKIPKSASPIPEIIVETLSSQDQDEHITTIPNLAESEQKPGNESHTPETANIPGLISCTQPAGSEETTKRENSESNQQGSTDTTMQNSRAGTTVPSNETAASGQNLGGSGSGDDEDEDEDTQKRFNTESKEPESNPELRKKGKSKKKEDSKQQAEVPQDQSIELETRVLTRSKSDESASKMEDTKKLERTLSKSNEGTISCSRQDQLLSSSGLKDEDHQQPADNISVDPLMCVDNEESIIVLKDPYEESSDEEDSSDDETQIASSSTKRKEAPTPENSKGGTSKVPAAEGGKEPKYETVTIIVGYPRPAKITHRRLARPPESDISDLDRGLGESGISEVSGSSDGDASGGEDAVSDSEDYVSRRRLTRNQAAQIEAHQQQQPRPALGIVSSEQDKVHSSPSPEPEQPVVRPSVIFSNTTVYDSSDSGSTHAPKDSASSANSSENTLSSNPNEQAIPRQAPSIEDLNLPQDVEYDIERLYYRKRPTTDPLIEFLEIVPPPHTEKRKRSTPGDGIETKKIKTGEDNDQQCASEEVDQDGDVDMVVANPEEPISDCDREVEAIMATEVKKEESENGVNRRALHPIRRLSIFMPQDNKGQTRVVLFPPTVIESSFVPYVPPKKNDETPSKSDSLDSSKLEEKQATEKKDTDVPKEESMAPTEEKSAVPPKEEITESPKEQISESPKQNKTEEQNKSGNRRESLGTSKQDNSAASKRNTWRKRESLEPQKKNTRKGSPQAPAKIKSAKFGKTTPQTKSEPPAASKKSNNDKPSGGTCKESTNKKTQRNDKEDPDSSSQGRNAGRRQTRSPVKKQPIFRR